ncbi:MAG: hypothetical protein RR619_04670, partial [Raoultibacter sp.]
MMISDFGTLIWLRVRHMRTAFSRMMHLAGTSLADSEQLGDRVYQIYIMAFLLVALGLLWVALLDAVEVVFSDLGASFALLAFQGALAIPVILFVAWGMYALWSTPLKFTHADITYVASSSLDSRALVFVRSGWTMCIGAMVAALAGYALGVGLCSGLGVDSNLLVMSALGALSVAAALGGVWVVGILRLIIKRKRFRSAVAGVVALLVLGVGCLGAITQAAPTSESLALYCASSAVALGASLLLLSVLARRIDMTAAIEESALYADLQPLGAL